MKKRIAVLSDTHCGHLAGLTPPPWQSKPRHEMCRKRVKLVEAQNEMWRWYEERVAEYAPVHAVLFNGDAIDGRGERSKSSELITSDRNEQVNMAHYAIDLWKAKRHVFTYGTAYHTGEGEDFEDNLAASFGAKIGSHEWVGVNGTVFDLRHHVGSSSMPHGRKTAIEKQKLWNQIWVARDYQPSADVLIRSHVHYYGCASDTAYGKEVTGFTTPALQGHGSKYGARRCDGVVDIGFLVFDVDDDGSFTWQPVLAQTLEGQKASVTSL